MRYLIINGSPHKGNTWKLAECVVRNIKEKDVHCEIREIHLMELGIPFCTGCSNCFRKGGQYCPHKDKMEIVLNALEWADGVIIASTTFNTRETGLLKNLFDHMCYLLHRPQFFTKKAFVLTSVGGAGGSGTIKSVTGTLYGIGFNKCYSFCCKTASWNSYCLEEKSEKKIRKITGKFVDDVKSKQLHYPKVEVLIPYNLFRGMGRYYKPGSEYATADGIHWTEETRMHRVYERQVPIHIYQKIIGSFFYCLGKTMGKKVVVTYRK